MYSIKKSEILRYLGYNGQELSPEGLVKAALRELMK